MLRVRVELWPRGANPPITIAEMEIENTGDNPQHPDWGNYTARITTHRLGGDMGLHTRRITDFPRLRANAWALVLRALLALGPDMMENDDDDDSPFDGPRTLGG